jgi:hypothetical protein
VNVKLNPDPNSAALAMLSGSVAACAWGEKKLKQYPTDGDDVLGPLVAIAALAAGAHCFQAFGAIYSALINPKP